MSNTTSSGSSEVVIDPPSLELDLGYSITEARPSLKVKFSLGTMGTNKVTDHFSLMMKRWRVSWKGASDGKKEIAKVDNENYTAYEEDILRKSLEKIHSIEIVKENYLRDARKVIEELHVGKFSSSEAIERVRNQMNGWLRLYNESLIQANNNSLRCKNSFDTSEESLNTFVKEKKLHTKTAYSKPSIWKRSSSLMVLVAAEALISFPIIGEKHDLSQIEAFLYPLTVSCANVLIGITTGAIGIYTILNSDNKKFKIAALVGCILSILIAVWMNLAVGRWREGLDLSLSMNGILPVSAFSVVLFVIGLCVYVFAIYKGIKDFSTGVPGHVDKWIEYTSSKNEYSQWKDRYLYLIHEMRKISQIKLDETRHQIDEIKNEYKIRIKYAEKIIIDLQTMVKVLPGSIENINSSARILLKTYRESAYLKNGKVESLSKSKYFDKVDTNLTDISKAKERTDNLIKEIKDNLQELSIFEEQFEKEIASSIGSEIEKVSNESYSEA